MNDDPAIEVEETSRTDETRAVTIKVRLERPFFGAGEPLLIRVAQHRAAPGDWDTVQVYVGWGSSGLCVAPEDWPPIAAGVEHAIAAFRQRWPEAKGCPP